MFSPATNAELSLKNSLLSEFDLDSDEFDEDEPTTQSSRRRPENTMPLLVGLIDSRRSLDSSIPLQANGNGHAPSSGNLDLEELAAKRTAGGGLLDSIANMANSILGAGK